MDKKNDIKKIWTECFSDTPRWVEMYFDRVYRDEFALTREADGLTVSSMLLLHYDFLFHGRMMSASYVSGAATRRQARGQGHMSVLMVDALRESRARGDMLCTLIPAQDHLYFFYDHFGFSTVFYVDKQRYTSLHAFAGGGDYREVENHFDSSVYDAMQRMERLRGCGIVHSQRDFLNIMDDLSLEPDARFVAMASPQGEVCSLAWAVKSDGVVQVRELLSVDRQAATAALRALRAASPDTPFCLWAPAQSGHRHLYARGMARIVNVPLCLEAIAAANPLWRCALRVTDPLMPENSHIYRVADGLAVVDDFYAGRLDFDVALEVLNAMVFSDKSVGEILNFPSCRAHMALMLD